MGGALHILFIPPPDVLPLLTERRKTRGTTDASVGAI